MNPTATKLIKVDQETYQIIVEMARQQSRTIGGQVAYMAKMFKNSYRVVTIEPMPSPEGAEVVPLVEVVPLG
jgi:hypothetical protein